MRESCENSETDTTEKVQCHPTQEHISAKQMFTLSSDKTSYIYIIVDVLIFKNMILKKLTVT